MVTGSASPLVDALPGWVGLIRAPNPGVMTLEGTNTWVVRGPDAAFAVVIDPGPADEGHLAAVAGCGPVSDILLTHGHPDHVDGAARLAELLGGVEVRAADPAHCSAGRPFEVGESFDAAGVHFRVLHTPGHTADSVCFAVAPAAAAVDAAAVDAERVLFTGDTVLGRGTTVVAWPDGDLGSYLTSLETLTAYDGVLVLPGHGPVLPDCAEVARAYLTHRWDRLAQVRAAVAAGDRTAAEVVARVYAQVDPALWPAAEWSVRAQLAYLRAGGRTAERESGSGTPGLDPL